MRRSLLHGLFFVVGAYGTGSCNANDKLLLNTTNQTQKYWGRLVGAECLIKMTQGPTCALDKLNNRTNYTPYCNSCIADRGYCVAKTCGAAFCYPDKDAPKCIECAEDNCQTPFLDCVTPPAPSYKAELVAYLKTMTLRTPLARLTQDPYQTPGYDTTISSNDYCVIMLDSDNKAYELQTKAYSSDELQTPDPNRLITHQYPCGVCSTMQDLSVYMGVPDLTTPVKSCAFLGLAGDSQASIECLWKIGFTKPCADIWFFNQNNTQDKCLDECLVKSGVGDSNNLANGELNPCIQCDEDNSGPVFKKVSGRTRRNSGLASAINRPGFEVYDMVHNYIPGFPDPVVPIDYTKSDEEPDLAACRDTFDYCEPTLVLGACGFNSAGVCPNACGKCPEGSTCADQDSLVKDLFGSVNFNDCATVALNGFCVDTAAVCPVTCQLGCAANTSSPTASLSGASEFSSSTGLSVGIFAWFVFLFA